MKIKFFASTLGLPHSNPWRVIFQQGKKLRDPRWQNILRIAGMLSFVGVIVGYILLSRELVIYDGTFPYPLSVHHLLLFFGTTFLFVVGGICMQMSIYELELEEATRRLAKISGFTLDSISFASAPQLRGLAINHLEYLGYTIIEQEKKDSDPFSKDREKKKEEFRKAYSFFLDIGLIDDVGYGRFIRSK